jgi:tRNA-dihydrouridine synthase
MPNSFQSLLAQPGPILALAPMQDISDLPFWRVIAAYGGADVYVTEYFRVYPGSHLNRHILRSITQNPTGRPVIAQMIGNDIPSLVGTARELQHHPVAAIDLNLGCPAPVVYRKCAGGGLLRELDRVDAILGALREAVQLPFTVKTRIGFDRPEEFDDLLPVFQRHAIDLVTIHGRTVHEMYRSEVHYDRIQQGVKALCCPVLANGNVSSGATGLDILRRTGARGLMIGRGAIRNPWIFDQLRSLLQGREIRYPEGRAVLGYVRRLHEAVCPPGMPERARVQRIKKHLNFLGLGVEPSGAFLHAIRRVAEEADLFRVCSEHLDHDQPMPLEPFDLGLGPRDMLAGPHGAAERGQASLPTTNRFAI